MSMLFNDNCLQQCNIWMLGMKTILYRTLASDPLNQKSEYKIDNSPGLVDGKQKINLISQL